MAAASLASYDGSAGVLVDTNVWVDCIDTESAWHEWAVEQLQLRSERAPLHVNLIIYTELLVPGPDVAALAAKAFGIYRRRGGTRLLPLPDFFIGAHAAVANLSLLTRDPAGYATYFPRLSLIGPK